MSFFYSILKSIGAVLVLIYLLYFSMIAYRAFQTIKILKKTYQYSVGTTIFTMFMTAVLMTHNGQASQRLDTFLFASLYTLLNFYIYLVSFFYAPVIG